MFFLSSDGDAGLELWKTDGTASEAELVKDIRPGPDSSGIAGLTDLDGTLLFRADDGIHGSELWKSDGTEAGTVLVKDILPGPEGSSAFPVATMGGQLYFLASDGVTGFELWKSDGTAPGTMLLKDIVPGPAGSGPQQFAEIDSVLYFSAAGATGGRELWRSDGTEEGTFLAADIHPGPDSSSPIWLAALGNFLLFNANDGETGAELWRLATVSADLSVEKVSNSFFTEPGGSLVYEIAVSNAGPDDVAGARVQDPEPGRLDFVTWECVPTGPCSSTSGSDSIDTTVDLPAGDSVTLLVGAQLLDSDVAPVTNTASVEAPFDVEERNPADNSDSDTDRIGLFVDSFETAEPD
jgi:uncharacterized repeat protein (TIGR01451 family)